MELLSPGVANVQRLALKTRSSDRIPSSRGLFNTTIAHGDIDGFFTGAWLPVICNLPCHFKELTDFACS